MHLHEQYALEVVYIPRTDSQYLEDTYNPTMKQKIATA